MKLCLRSGVQYCTAAPNSRKGTLAVRKNPRTEKAIGLAVLRILRKAKELIKDERHWVTGREAAHRYRDPQYGYGFTEDFTGVSVLSKQANAFCAIGAIKRAAHDLDLDPQLGNIAQAMADEYADRYSLDRMRRSGRSQRHVASIMELNDTNHDYGLPAVHAVFDQCIEDIPNKGLSPRASDGAAYYIRDFGED